MTLFKFTNGLTRDYIIGETGRIFFPDGTGSIVHDGDDVHINTLSDSHTLKRVDDPNPPKVKTGNRSLPLIGMRVRGKTLINCTRSTYPFLWRDGTYSILPLSSYVAALEEEGRSTSGKIGGELPLSVVQMRLPEPLATPLQDVLFLCERDVVQFAGERRPDIVALNERGSTQDGPIYDGNGVPVLYRGVVSYSKRG